MGTDIANVIFNNPIEIRMSVLYYNRIKAY